MAEAPSVNARTTVRLRDLALFTRQFVAMLDAGVPLHKALDMYAKGDEGKLGRVIYDIGERVLAGNSLSASLSYYPRVFSPVYVGITRAGEQSGRLNLMLEQLAVLLERQDGLYRKLSASLTYPAFLIVACILCSAAFMFYILPAMGPLYTTLGVPLPWPTRMLVNLGNFLRNPLTLGMSALTVAMVVFTLWPAFQRSMARNTELRRKIHQGLLDIPLLGSVMRRMIYARLLFTLSTLLEVGIPSATALVMVRDISGNEAIRQGLAMSCVRLEHGCGLGEALDAVFPTAAVMMITVGEESSNVVRATYYVAKVYEEDAEMAVEYFAAMSEPLIMAGMGVVAAFLILALILPIVALLQRM